MDKLFESLYSPPHLCTDAISHGRTYEPIAKRAFAEKFNKRIDECGFFVHPLYPFLGASPDGIIKEEDALVEVKCPYKFRDETIQPGEKFDFLKKNKDGSIHLIHKDNYYYQVSQEKTVMVTVEKLFSIPLLGARTAVNHWEKEVLLHCMDTR